MTIECEQNDAPDFISNVEGLVNGLLAIEAPSSLRLIKIDNWFGPKWLGFSGKILGALGVSMTKLTIPPFVPNRVVSEKEFVGPLYSEIGDGGLIHLSLPSSVALTRRAIEIAPGAILFWYSGGSQTSGRGSAMAYVPAGTTYCNWYVEWASRESWRLVKGIGIHAADLANLTDRGLIR